MKVPVVVAKVSSCASYMGIYKRKSVNAVNGDTYEGDGEEQDDDEKVYRHQDVVQAPDSTVQIAHRVLDGQLLAVALPIDVDEP